MMYLLCFLLSVIVDSYSATDSARLVVHITTWNVNQNSPPKDLKPLLGLKRHPDVIAVGLQEVAVSPLQAFWNMIIVDQWTRAFKKTAIDNGYTKVQKVAMVGIVLNVYVQNRHNNTLSVIDCATVRTGCKGYYGNKGGVALAIRLYGSTLTFVAAHLAPNDGALQQRIDNYHVIEKIRGLRCGIEDFIFWFGDFNFRLNDKDLTANRIQQMVQKLSLIELLSKDELNDIRLARQAFEGYNEMPITFLPTYRYKVGTNDHDLKRRPAWTDRVLYRAAEGREIIPVRYGVFEDFDISDHKPVWAVFLITVSA